MPGFVQDINATLKMVAQVLKASTCFVAFLDCWGFPKFFNVFWNFKRNKQTTTQSNPGINLTNACSAKKATYIYEVPEDSVDLKKKSKIEILYSY